MNILETIKAPISIESVMEQVKLHKLNIPIKCIEEQIDNIIDSRYIMYIWKYYYLTKEWKIIHFSEWMWNFFDLWDIITFWVYLSHIDISLSWEINTTIYKNQKCFVKDITNSNWTIFKKLRTIKWLKKVGTFISTNDELVEPKILWITVKNFWVSSDWSVSTNNVDNITFNKQWEYNPKTIDLEWQKYVIHNTSMYIYHESEVFWKQVNNKKLLKKLRVKFRECLKQWEIVQTKVQEILD